MIAGLRAAQLRGVLRLALSDLGFDPLRTALSILGLGAVIVCALLLGALAGQLAAFVNIPSSSTALMVIDGTYIDPGDSTVPDDVLRAMQTLQPQFAARVSPMFFRHLRINDRLVQLRGAPPADWTTVHHLVLQSGRWPQAAGEVAVGEGLAASAGWATGSVLTIYGSDMTVTAVYRSPGTAFAAVWMPLDSARALFGPERLVQMVLVQVAPAADAADVLARLEAMPEIAGRFTVFYEDTYTRRNSEFVRDLYGLLYVASVLALIGVALGAYAATALHLAERPREVALLRVAGFSLAQVRAYLLMRAELLAAGAFVAGTAIGAVWLRIMATGGPLYTFDLPVQLEIDLKTLAIYAGLTLCLALAGALVSSRALLRASVAEGLRS